MHVSPGSARHDALADKAAAQSIRGRDETLATWWLRVALVLLSPVFAAVAVLIKLDSRGPVFFRQRRRGYNTAEFRIWKFRTMTSLDDGDTIVQATENDGRVTASEFSAPDVARRASSAPQCLKGEMSLVGPRPHAVAHDRFFERRIARYPRRLNVKPGITGWAQVNGFRGATVRRTRRGGGSITSIKSTTARSALIFNSAADADFAEGQS